jgi:hypothetical protein
MNYLEHLEDITNADVTGLKVAEQSYGDSWKKRGGIGAFMMLARKWDRLERAAERTGYDIFRAIIEDNRQEGVIDDIRDLRRYLLLVEAEMRDRNAAASLTIHRDNVAAGGSTQS